MPEEFESENEASAAEASAHLPGFSHMENMDEGLLQFTKDKIEQLRTGALDLTRKNRYINTQLYGNTTRLIRVVDEQPGILFAKLIDDKKLSFDPLPRLDSDPADEDEADFNYAFLQAQIIDEDYSHALEAIDASAEDAEEQKRELDRQLKDKVREQLGMPARAQDKAHQNLADHARQNGINPDYELPPPDEVSPDGRHEDRKIQTLLLPKDLERVAQGVYSRGQSFLDETGVNIVRGAFGFLEWKDVENDDQKFCSPLILLPVSLEKKASRGGFRFSVTSAGDGASHNRFLLHKLKNEFGLDLPVFDGEEDGLEDYLKRVQSELDLNKIEGRVRRLVCFGDFRALQIAIYEDLDPNEIIVTDIVDALLNGSESSADSSGTANEYETDDPNIAKKVPRLVLDSDASQFSALVDIADGKNLAVEGPPGTGKSQMIVNAIASALHGGKKVLFVASKKAAIEVVESRLKACGLGEFVLPIHPNESRKEFVQSLAKRVNMDPVEDRRAYFDRRKKELSKLQEYLSDHIKFLGGKSGFGEMSRFDAMSEYIKEEGKVSELPRELREEIHSEFARQYYESDSVGELLEKYQSACIEVEKASTIWDRFAGSVSVFQAKEIIDECVDISESIEAINDLKINLEQDSLMLEQEDNFIGENASAEIEIIGLAANLEAVLGDALKELAVSEENHNIDIESIESILESLSNLSRFFQNIPSRERLSELKGILDTLEHLDLHPPVHATHDILNDLIRADQEKRHELEIARECKAEFEPFFERQSAELKSVGLDEFRAAAELAKNLPDEISSRLGEFEIDAQDVRKLAGLIRRARELKKLKDSLTPKFSFFLMPPLGMLLQHVSKLSQPEHFFSFLDFKYRKARNFYLSINKNKTAPFDREQAAGDLFELAEHQKMSEDLRSSLPEVLAAFDSEDEEGYLNVLELIGLIRDDQNVNKLQDHLFRDLSLLASIPRNVRFLEKNPFTDPYQVFSEWLNEAESEYQQLHQNALNGIGFAEEIGGPIGYETFSSLVSDIERCRLSIEQVLTETDFLDKLIDVDNNTIEEITAVLRAVKQLDEELLGPAEKRKFLASHLNCREGRDVLEELKELGALHASFQEKVKKLHETEGLKKILDFQQKTFAEIKATLDGCMAEGAQPLLLASDKNSLRNRLSADEAVSKVVKAIETYNTPEGHSLTEAGRLMAVHSVAQVLANECPRELEKFKTHDLVEGARVKFAELDEQVIKLNRKILALQIQEQCSPPPGIGRGRRSEWTDMSLINHQISLEKRYKSPRHIVSKARDALLELKPCWMMSPLAVAQYVDKNNLSFDLVIIDEASQMEPYMAMGAIMRGKQLVVVGDQNQLPPTDFFVRDSDSDEVDEDLQTQEESILQMANLAFHPKRRLRWHYRSRDGRLIAYSNKKMYDGDLIIFPHSNPEGSSLGVHQIPVENAVYRSGTNPLEAQAMLDGIAEFMKAHRNKSLGVVVMNIKQQELLQQMFDQLQVTDTEIAAYCEAWEEKNGGLEKFFIKNIEKVQGDERDVIFIGTVYGPEEAGGKVHQRFGPIAGINGRRRLNVLFSRAKCQMVTYTSLQPGDVNENNPGTAMLSGWLSYSKTGILEAGEVTKREPESPFEEHVISLLRDAGYEVDPQVGVSGYFVDIGIKHPEYPYGYLLGVECDGAKYHSSKSARERDRLRQQILKERGWCIHRIWSTNWFQNPKHEFEKLQRAISKRLMQAKTQPNVSSAAADELHQNVDDDELENLDLSESPSHAGANDSASGSDQVGFGTRFTLHYLEASFDDENLAIAEKGQTPAPLRGVISPDSPIAKAVWGCKTGEVVAVRKDYRLHRVRIQIED